jgi:hypothetical protein
MASNKQTATYRWVAGYHMLCLAAIVGITKVVSGSVTGPRRTAFYMRCHF